MLSRLLKRLMKRLKSFLFVDETPVVKEEFDTKGHDELVAKIWERVEARKQSGQASKPTPMPSPQWPSSEIVLDHVKRMSVDKHPRVISSPSHRTHRTIEEPVYTRQQPSDGIDNLIVGAVIASSFLQNDNQPTFQESIQEIVQEQSYQPDPEPIASSDWETTSSYE